MLTSEERHHNKSTKGMRMRSPLDMRQKISVQDHSKEKNSMGRSNGSTNDSMEF